MTIKAQLRLICKNINFTGTMWNNSYQSIQIKMRQNSCYLVDTITIIRPRDMQSHTNSKQVNRQLGKIQDMTKSRVPTENQDFFKKYLFNSFLKAICGSSLTCRGRRLNNFTPSKETPVLDLVSLMKSTERSSFLRVSYLWLPPCAV